MFRRSGAEKTNMRSVCVPSAGWLAGVVILVLGVALPARAQYGRPSMSDPALGEQYHVEAMFDFWSPNLEATISSESLGIIGSDIDLKTDLGYVNKQVREFRLVLRPGKKHKFRIAYIPVSYAGDVLLTRKVIFNGIEFNVGLPVQTEFKWNTWRLGYEYDFVSNDRGFVGFITEIRETDVSLSLQSPIDTEFTRARGPIPAIGGIARVYPVKNFSITGEFTGFKIPKISDYQGHFFDFDIYGVFNIPKNFGAQGGFRTLDISYLAKKDTGDLKMKGVYFGGIARF
jgi:hypothetical protein